MKIIKDFFTPPDLNQREIRFHTTIIVAAIFPIIFYSAFFIYFVNIGSFQFLPIVGTVIFMFLVGLILAHYRKHVLGGIWLMLASVSAAYLLTFLSGWKYGFQFAIIPPLLFSGIIFKDQSTVKFIFGFVALLAFTLLGYLTYNIQDNNLFPEGHGVYILLANLIVPLWGPAMSTIASLVFAEQVENKLAFTFAENEKLLHNILPASIAKRLRQSNDNIVDRFESVSILFADIVNFTPLAEKFPPQQIVDILNGMFSKFDDLTEKYNLEKIKTIGDAYMVASGVPERKRNHAETLFLFAQEMLDELHSFNQSHNLKLSLRIGISSGPVVAGVIGKKKFSYDLWGDTVNTAARMESHGQAGKVQVSENTYQVLKEKFEFIKIPNVEIKGKGKIDVYIWEP